MLPALMCITPMMRTDACNRTQVDIRIESLDVHIGVMKHRMLPAPQVRAAADHVQRQCAQAIDPAPARIRAMSAIVFDIETDSGCRKTQQYGQRHCRPRAGSEKHQCRITCKKHRKNDRAFQIHRRIVTLAATGFGKPGVNAASQFVVEILATREGESRGRTGCGRRMLQKGYPKSSSRRPA